MKEKRNADNKYNITVANKVFPVSDLLPTELLYYSYNEASEQK